MQNRSIMKLTVAGLLIAIGIVIPMFSPAKIIIPPASFTPASHVAIFVAMFISPAMAVLVAFGTTMGFLLGGFPIVIVLRAATHSVFAFLGSLYLHKISKGRLFHINNIIFPLGRLSPVNLRVFSLFIALIHAVGEIVVVSVFYFGGNISPAHLEQGFLMSVLILVGLGTVVHSMVDFEIANIVVVPLKKQIDY